MFFEIEIEVVNGEDLSESEENIYSLITITTSYHERPETERWGQLSRWPCFSFCHDNPQEHSCHSTAEGASQYIYVGTFVIVWSLA